MNKSQIKKGLLTIITMVALFGRASLAFTFSPVVGGVSICIATILMVMAVITIWDVDI